MRILLWLVRALLFFALFAFALNNQHEAVLKGFFGFEWRAPMVIVVLVSFAAGAALAIAALAPRLWRTPPDRVRRESPGPSAPPRSPTSSADEAPTGPADLPIRDGI